jgi:hypothetical protein
MCRGDDYRPGFDAQKVEQGRSTLLKSPCMEDEPVVEDKPSLSRRLPVHTGVEARAKTEQILSAVPLTGSLHISPGLAPLLPGS